MKPARLSITRKFFLWYWRYPPFNPYVTVHFAADVRPARTYVDGLERRAGPRVTLHHVVTAALARAYRDHPYANASVSGNEVVRHPHVGAAMPVDLPGEPTGHELGFVLVREAETLSLRQLAARTRGSVDRERHEGRFRAVRRLAYGAIDRTPSPVLNGALGALDLACRAPAISRAIHRQYPVTVLLSNVGAAIGMPGGTVVRGGSMTLPNRFFGIGSVLGVFPIQSEVLAIDGRAEACPVLPMSYMFDHRLFDGVAAGRVLSRLAEILANPAVELGDDGER